MIGIQTRRSIVFQLWLRLSAITVVFTFLALGAYLWLEISDEVDSADDQAATRAIAIGSAISRLQETLNLPGEREIAMIQTLDVVSVQFIGPDGEVVNSYGELTGAGTTDPIDPSHLAAGVDGSYEIHIEDDGFVRKDVGALDLLRGGRFGSVNIVPSSSTTFEGSLRIVTEYPDIVGDTRTLVVRSIALAGGILAFMVAGLWELLERFVARPLRAYSATAHRIAAGELLRMPDASSNELGQLGRAINGMADILRHQATIDALTGLYNLQHLTGCLEGLVDEAKQRSEPLSLLVCDLDNLKPVNDTYGHHIGDQLLKQVAFELLEWSSLDYICWRTGGDEFAVLIPGANREDALRAAADLEKKINSSTIVVGPREVPISLSVGIATYPFDGSTGAALINVADLRMYAAKSAKAKSKAPSAAA